MGTVHLILVGTMALQVVPVMSGFVRPAFDFDLVGFKFPAIGATLDFNISAGGNPAVFLFDCGPRRHLHFGNRNQLRGLKPFCKQ